MIIIIFISKRESLKIESQFISLRSHYQAIQTVAARHTDEIFDKIW